MKIKANGIEINYRIDGPEGAPWVTFSNSLATTHHMWDPQVEAFTRSYRVLRYDKRGHGETEVTPAPTPSISWPTTCSLCWRLCASSALISSGSRWAA